MPAPAQWIGAALPLTHYLKVIRGIVLKGVGIPELWPQLVALAFFALAFFTFASMRFHKDLE
jgi:ABC-2 type transport system permease protein